MNAQLDCIVIGYNEVPSIRYEQFLHAYGEDSEAYSDLKFSFVNPDGRKLDYPGLLNHLRNLAGRCRLPAFQGYLPDDDPEAYPFNWFSYSWT